MRPGPSDRIAEAAHNYAQGEAGQGGKLELEPWEQNALTMLRALKAGSPAKHQAAIATLEAFYLTQKNET